MLSDLTRRIRCYINGRDALDAFCFLISILIQFLRGLSRGYWLVFIGKNVTMRARRNIHIGKFTRIEDYCELDGFGDTGLHIGAFCKIGKFSIIRVPPAPHKKGVGIVIDDHTTFAEYCFVGGAAQVRIGLRNSFGQYVSIHPQNHLPIGQKEHTQTHSIGIIIGDDNWFGAKSTILDGTIVGNRTIVAAEAAVRGKFEDDVLLAGVPAIIKRKHPL